MAHSPHPNMCHISFMHVPVTSMWVVALHSLFLYSDPPPLCHLHSDWLRLFSSQTFSRTNNPTFSTCLWGWKGQSVPTRWHIKFRRWGITQKKAYNIQNVAKVLNQELWDVFVMDWVLFLHVPAVRPSWWIVFVPHFKQWRLPRARILYRNIILSDKCH